MTVKGAPFTISARLQSPAEFRHVFARGRKVVTDGFVVIVAPGQASEPRLGMALAKRRIKRAVDRNRVKRVVRESFRAASTHMPVADIVVLARNGTAGMSNKALFGQLAAVWSDVANRFEPRADNRFSGASR